MEQTDKIPLTIPLYSAVLRPDLDHEGRITGYHFLYRTDDITTLQECALSRAYQSALERGVLQPGDLSQVQFVDENGNKIQTVELVRSAVEEFFANFLDLHPFGASQHMSEVGKILTASRSATKMLELLFSPAFAARMDTHKFLKLLQIMCQPGRVTGVNTVITLVDGVKTAVRKDLEPVKDYDVRAYIDSKREQEDGPIYVHPDTWDNIIIPAYSIPEQPLIGATLIKVNSCTSFLTIKGVMKRASHSEWARIIERSGRDDFDLLLCGNAIKDNDGYTEGEVYNLDQFSFAHHSDSIVERGFRVNIPNQVMNRSGMDNHHFTKLAAGPALTRLAGLMQFDEDQVLAAIGAFTKDGKETSLDSAAAIKKRIMEHHLPANHPVNATQIYRLAMTVIKDHLTKIEVPGFHGMGAPSNNQRGYVGVPRHVFNMWLREHHSNSAYLFRMPYLGSYCGMFVTLIPMNTDSILVNWEDALQTEGDFDGDQYYVVPSVYIQNPEAAQKPPRAPKGAKSVLALTEANLRDEIIALASNKMGIGPRDSLLSMAFDYYNEAKFNGDQAEIQHWQTTIGQLQIWVQQAVEGLKHGHANQLTRKQVQAMMGDDPAHHIYTKLFAKRTFKEHQLQSTRLTKGYIDLIRMNVKPEHSWHPLHHLMTEIAKLQFGEVLDIQPYYEAIAAQPVNGWSLSRSSRKELWRGIRGLQRKYARGVARWDGGKNKNISFGNDVLKPLREDWAKVLAALAEGGERVNYEVHLMLANVAYEPQPNWKLYGDGSGYFREGLFHRMKRTGRSKATLRTEGKLLMHQPKDRKPLLTGEVTVTIHGRAWRYHKWLPRPGSLFHHLATPEQARLILKSVLPSVEPGDLLRELIVAALHA